MCGVTPAPASDGFSTTAVLGNGPAPAPTTSPGSPTGASDGYVLQIFCMDADPQSSTAFSTAMSSKFESFFELAPSKFLTCTVTNYFIQNRSGDFVRPPIALYDTGCNIQSGLVFSLRYCQKMKFDLQAQPRGRKKFSCKLANGSIMEASGYVHRAVISVDNEILEFNDVPVFADLSYDVIFGFVCFAEKSLFIRSSGGGRVKLVMDHLLNCSEKPLGRNRRGVRGQGAMQAFRPPQATFPCSVPSSAKPTDHLYPADVAPKTIQPFHSSYSNSNSKLSAQDNEIECHDDKCLGCLSPSCRCDIDAKYRNNCVLNENEGSNANVNGCEIELEFESLETALPHQIESHDFVSNNIVIDGEAWGLEAGTCAGEGESVTLEDLFEVFEVPGGSLPFDSNSDIILEENVSPPLAGAPAPGPDAAVKIKHIGTQLLKNNQETNLSSGAKQEKAKRDSGEIPLSNRASPNNVNNLSQNELTTAAPNATVPPEITSHALRGKPMRMKLRRRTRMINIIGAIQGDASSSVRLPPVALEPLSITYFNVRVDGGGDPPTGRNPGFMIPEEVWIAQGVVIPEGIHSRKLRTARIGVANTNSTPFLLDADNVITGYMVADSLTPNVAIPQHPNMRITRDNPGNRKAARRAVECIQLLRENSDISPNEQSVSVVETLANNLNADKGFTVKNPKTLSDSEKRELLAQLQVPDNDYLLRKGGKGFPEEFTRRILEQADVFALPGGARVGETSMEVELKLKEGAKPPQAKARPLNPPMLDNLREQLRQWQEDGVIEPSTSEFSSPLVPVKKKSGEIRWAVDYRALNSVLEGDSFPLPNIAQLLDQAAGHEIYSTLDVSQAFLSIKIASSSRGYTSFVCPLGSFQFARLPFGLKVSPQIYSRFIAAALKGLANGNISVYLDDVLLGSNDAKEHLERLIQLLEAHRKAGLLLKPSKCKLFREKIEFLGHELSKDGIATSPAHTSVICAWNRPVTGKELASFLGLCTYYSEFIPNFPKLAAPLHTLKNSKVISWSDHASQCFEQLKAAFEGPLIRAAPNYDIVKESPFILTTDWSKTAMAWTLSQVQNGQERLIHAGGRKCSAGESNYPSYKGELCALVSAIKRLDHYLSLTPFVVRTDNSALRWLVNLKAGEAIVVRWGQILGRYEFRVEHVPGKDNIVADALSRNPDLYTAADDQEDMQRDEEAFCQLQPSDAPETMVFTPGEGLKEVEIGENEQISSVADNLAELQRKDPVLRIVREWLAEGQPPQGANIGYCLATYRRIFEQLAVDSKDRLIRRFTNCFGVEQRQFLLPYAAWEAVWSVVHLAEVSPHPGVQRTLEQCKRWFYAPDLKQLVEVRIGRCNDCRLRSHNLTLHQGEFSRDMGAFPNDLWSCDIMGRMSEDEGCHYILSCQDTFSRFLFLEPLKDKSAKSVAEALFRIIRVAGLPQRIRTDMGTEFHNALLRRIQRRWNIRLTHSVPYFHQSNMVERVHRELNRSLKLLLSDPPHGWVQAITPLALAYNSQPNRVTGFSPNMVFFGRESFHPLTLQLQPDDDSARVKSPAEHLQQLKGQADIIAEKLYRANQVYLKKMADVYRDHPDQNEIAVGSSVYFVSKFWPQPGMPDRLTYRWAGPGEVVKVDKNYYTIEARDSKNKMKQIVLHISCIRLAAKKDTPQALGEVPFEPEEYTDLLLPPFPSLPDDFELPQDAGKQVSDKVGYEPDAGEHDVPLPNPQDPVALAAPEPRVTRAGRISRPPARYPQQVVTPADYINLLREIA